jgi:hypothetical protein
LEYADIKIKDEISYDPEEGTFKWLTKRRGRKLDKVGGKSTEGYLIIRILGKYYYGHRLAWYLYYGEWPNTGKHIDHIDRNKLNNKISNLRLVTPKENMFNKVSAKGKVNNYRGVSYRKDRGKWRAQISINNKCVHLGTFLTEEEAYASYLSAAKEIHGEFFIEY